MDENWRFLQPDFRMFRHLFDVSSFLYTEVLKPTKSYLNRHFSNISDFRCCTSMITGIFWNFFFWKFGCQIRSSIPRKKRVTVGVLYKLDFCVVELYSFFQSRVVELYTVLVT